MFYQEDSEIIDATAFKSEDWGANEEHKEASEDDSLKATVQIDEIAVP